MMLGVQPPGPRPRFSQVNRPLTAGIAVSLLACAATLLLLRSIVPVRSSEVVSVAGRVSSLAWRAILAAETLEDFATSRVTAPEGDATGNSREQNEKALALAIGTYNSAVAEMQASRDELGDRLFRSADYAASESGKALLQVWGSARPIATDDMSMTPEHLTALRVLIDSQRRALAKLEVETLRAGGVGDPCSPL